MPLLATTLLALALLPAPADAGAASAPADRSGRPLVFVSIPPQAWFVARLGGERIAVEVLVGPGRSPATFDPTPRQLARLSDADLYLTIGVPMENLLVPRLRAGLPGLRIEAMDAGIARLPEAPAGAGPGPAADEPTGRAHGEPDPHIWLDPRLGKRLARNAAAALAGVDPAGEPLYRARLGRVEATLDSLDACLGRLLAPVRGRRIVTFHPAYGYLARAYGLTQVAIEQGGMNPTPRHLVELRGLLERSHVRAIFVQPEFAATAAEAAARGLGVAVVSLDPLARDYAANLVAMAGRIREALGGGPPPAGACPGPEATP